MYQLHECPICDSKKIKEVFEDFTLHYKHLSFTIPKLRTFACPKCKESFIDRDIYRKYVPKIRRMHKLADKESK